MPIIIYRYSYDTEAAARKAGEAARATLPKEWKPKTWELNVWDNCGWHWGIGRGPIYIWPGWAEPAAYLCMISSAPDNYGAGGPWTDYLGRGKKHDTPEAAVRSAVKAFFAYWKDQEKIRDSVADAIRKFANF